MKKRSSIIFLLFLFISISCFSQRSITRSHSFHKEDFIHTWKLFEIRNTSNELITRVVDKQTIQFTIDSIFIFKNKKSYAGTWTFENGQFQINVPGCKDCDYKWSVYDDFDKIICFRVGDKPTKLGCFKLYK